MDVNNLNNTQTPTPVPNAPAPVPSNGLATASLILGICSVVFICCGGGLIVGTLGIIFALLSRGASTMNSQAKVGLGLSIGAFAFSFIVIPLVLVAYVPYVLNTSEFKEQFNKEFNRQYNETYGDIYNDLFDEFDQEYQDILEQYDSENKSGDT